MKKSGKLRRIQKHPQKSIHHRILGSHTHQHQHHHYHHHHNHMIANRSCRSLHRYQQSPSSPAMNAMALSPSFQPTTVEFKQQQTPTDEQERMLASSAATTMSHPHPQQRHSATTRAMSHHSAAVDVCQRRQTPLRWSKGGSSKSSLLHLGNKRRRSSGGASGLRGGAIRVAPHLAHTKSASSVIKPLLKGSLFFYLFRKLIGTKFLFQNLNI